MFITTYTDFRQKMKTYLDAVFNSSTPLFITRPKGKNLVVMSQAEYESMIETYHLTKSPKNAERLQSALNEYKQKKGNAHKLLEE